MAELRLSPFPNNAGLPTEPLFSFGPAFGYRNGDRWVDLYVPRHYGHQVHGFDDLWYEGSDRGFVAAAPVDPATTFARDQHAAVWAQFSSDDPWRQDLFQAVGGREGDDLRRHEIEPIFFANRTGALRSAAVEFGLEAALAAGPLHRGRIALPTDFDRDGRLDLLLVGDRSPARLLRAIDGGFVDHSAEAGALEIVSRSDDGFRADMGDFDGDGFDDLILPMGRNSRLDVFSNSDGQRFEFRSHPELVRELDLVAVHATDFEGDGDDDVLAAPGRVRAERSFVLLRNQQGRFEVETFAVPGVRGRGVQIQSADLDNDGDLDVVLMTLGSLFLIENREGQFVDSTRAFGSGGKLQTRSGEFSCVALADIDRDGRLDLLAVRGRGGPGERDREPGPMLLVRNETPAAGSWLAIRLLGLGPAETMGIANPSRQRFSTSRSAIGSRVGWRMSGTEENWRWQRYGSGVSGTCQNDPVLHLGLGDVAPSRVDVAVEWASGHATTVNDLPIDQLHELTESSR